ncbi:MAG: hypothetical protein EAZ27_02665 [Cytophagales bacterium]|nr:MAG: hypothetical protein EAZ27_02665 [Cytophagales bacterium]
MNKYCKTILIIVTSSVSIFAQLRDISKLSDEKKHKVAHKLLEMNSPYNSIPILEDLLKKNPDSKKYIFKLAEAYFKSRNYLKAEELYPKLGENPSKNGKEGSVSVASFHYAECLKYNTKYEKAREQFEKFSTSNFRELKGSNLKALAKNEVKSCEYALQGKTSDVEVDFSHLGDNVNSNYTDFAPTLKDDNTLIFASIQTDSVVSIPFGESHTEHVKLFESDFDGTVWGDAKPLKSLNSKNGHTANGSFSADRKRFYFNICKNKVDNKVECKIYVTKQDSLGAFSKPEKLTGGINENGFTSTQPVVGTKFIKSKKNDKSKAKANETKEEVLFFVSDRKGTLGGLDIWYSTISNEGEIGEPVNCGKNINSIRDEITPYYDTDGGFLYFSSNFHPGFGGFDVFKSKGWNTKWKIAENLKKPVNSNFDETYYTLLPENKLEGFLVSNRTGGYGLLHPNCCDDIWQFNYKKPTILLVNAIDSLSNAEISDVLLLQSAKYEVFNDSSSKDSDGNLDFDTLAISDDKHFLKVIGVKENFENYYILGSKEKVNISVIKEGYNYAKSVVYTDSISMPKSFKSEIGTASSEINANIIKVNMLLTRGNRKMFVPQPEIIEKKDTVKIASTLKEQFTNAIINEPRTDVYVEDTTKKKVIEEIDFTVNLTFEYKSIELTGKNKLTLDSLVSIMTKNPKIALSLTTHTDGIGSEAYNQELSQKRANFIANYINKSGIPRQRIVSSTGVGESKPLFSETTPEGEDDIDARAKNRRTEIRFFKM